MRINHCSPAMCTQRAPAETMGQQVWSSYFSWLLGGFTAAFPFLCTWLQRTANEGRDAASPGTWMRSGNPGQSTAGMPQGYRGAKRLHRFTNRWDKLRCWEAGGPCWALLWRLALFCCALLWPPWWWAAFALAGVGIVPSGAGLFPTRRGTLSYVQVPAHTQRGLGWCREMPPGSPQAEGPIFLSYTTLSLLQVLGAGAAGEGGGVCLWAQKQDQDRLRLTRHRWGDHRGIQHGGAMARSCSGSPTMSGMKWQGPTGPTMGSRGVSDKRKIISSQHASMWSSSLFILKYPVTDAIRMAVPCNSLIKQ